MHSPDVMIRKVAICGFALIVLLAAGCAGPMETSEPSTPTVGVQPEAVVADTPTPAPEPVGPKTITIWHRWSERKAATVRELLDNYEISRPNVFVQMVYQADLYDALQAAHESDAAPDIVALPGDSIAEFVNAGLLASLDSHLDATWLAETYLSPSVEALRLDGALWGLPIGVQTVTFIYNMNLIRDEELAAQTSQILSKAREYQAAHHGVWYLVYPARDDVYFAAPWFYGAGAWYAREDGSVGLNTPAGDAAAAFLASLSEIMPPDIDYTMADALFKSKQAAIIVNGSWYLPELEAAGISYGLQIMPVVSSSGQPARPLVSVDGLMLCSESRYMETATQVMAYLTNAESELQLARDHDVVPANLLAIQRASDEGLALIVHFAKQAEVGQALPTTPYWGATWTPVQALLEALWEGEPAQDALDTAQRASEEYVATLGGR